MYRRYITNLLHISESLSFVLAIQLISVQTFGKAGNCTELLGALLGAAALENGEPSSSASVTPVALFRALELLGDPLRSKAVGKTTENPWERSWLRKS